MRIRVSNELVVEEPTTELEKWCEKNLIIQNPEYTKKARMGFSVYGVPKRISLYEIRGQTVVLPYGTLQTLPLDIVLDAEVVNEFAEAVQVEYGGQVPLYDYQEEAVDALVKAKGGILQSLPGSGKTQMGIALAKRFGVRTLWLCHTLDLINQSRERAKLYYSENIMGTISEGKVELGTGITFATVQTMSKLNLSAYKDYWDLIIVDEVHRVSGSPTTMTQYRKVLSSLSARHKYGLSATVHRADGLIQATYALIGGIAYKVPDEAVADKIERASIRPVGTGVEIGRKALNTDGTVNRAKLISYLTENESRNEIILACVEKDKSSLILSERLDHLRTLMQGLPPDMAKEAVMVDGKMTSKKGKLEREKALDEMRKGNKKYLFATYQLAKEGLDIPRLERLYLTTPQSDYAVITQSVGRISRTFPGKSEPIAYDFVDNIGQLVKSYKKRCTIYRKNKCLILEGISK